LPKTRAVITDYIGTLTNASHYTMEASVDKLYNALVRAGFPSIREDFLVEYGRAHEKYRLIRYGELKEVTNAVWVSEALSAIGFHVCVEDKRMNTALGEFFKDYIDSLKIRPCAQKLLGEVKKNCKLGLVSNFTYAPVVHESLQRLKIRRFFDAIVVSGDNGWRKPHRNIFADVLMRLGVSPDEAVFIGDSPLEDIKGAKDAGLRTVFVQSQFYGTKDLQGSNQKPDFVAADLEEICRSLAMILNCSETNKSHPEMH